MAKRKLCLALSFLSLSSVPHAAHGQAPQPIAALDFSALGRSVVSITATTIAGRSGGTGVIVDSTGTVLTAAHVIAGATDVTVRLASGEELAVEGVLEVDARLDLAILRIAGFGLRAAVLGNSDSVQLGERLVAIGNPLGLERTVSDGLLSSFRLEDGVRRMQVSIPVSPGSSGGPVFNASGEVVAVIVSGILSVDAQNLNFALPINYARGKLPLVRERKLMSVAEGGAAAALVGAGGPQLPSGATPRRVNADLMADYSTLNGAELWADYDDDAGARHIVQTTYRFSTSSDAVHTIERTEQDRVRVKVAALRSADAFIDRSLSTMTIGEVSTQRSSGSRTAIMNGVQPGSWTIAIASGMATISQAAGPSQVRVPLGTILPQFVGATIAALPDSLPKEVTIWIFDASTGASPQRFEFGQREEITLPFAQVGKPCDEGKNTIRKKVLVTWVTTAFDRYPVLTSAPHLRADPSVTKCIRLPN